MNKPYISYTDKAKRNDLRTVESALYMMWLCAMNLPPYDKYHSTPPNQFIYK